MTQNARYPTLARFLLDKSIERGSFTLASQQHSSYYCDGKKTSFDGEGVSLIADAILDMIEGLEVDAIGGMDMGATPIVSAVAMRSFQIGKPIPSFVVRREVKEHGTRKAIEGNLPENPSRVVIVDDVVTSGQSILKAIDAAREQGHEVVLAISVLDRESGGREAMESAGVRYQPLVTATELGIEEHDRERGSRSRAG